MLPSGLAVLHHGDDALAAPRGKHGLPLLKDERGRRVENDLAVRTRQLLESWERAGRGQLKQKQLLHFRYLTHP